MNLTNTIIYWTPGGAVALSPWPASKEVDDAYLMSTGACWGHLRMATFEQRKAVAFIEAMHMIIRDGCDPRAVHEALLGLDEYRDGCSEDMPGVAE